jgi:hypothetical protein
MQSQVPSTATSSSISANKSTGKELGLDLSDFNYQSDHFHNFVNSLETFSEEDLGKRWCFESTILYLNLPHLDNSKVDIVIKLLKWLKSKDVGRILYLKLPDCNAQYDINSFVYDEILTRFEVVHFNWIRLDVDIQKLAALNVQGRASVESSAESLTTLDIYSHGDFSGLVCAEHEDDIGMDMTAVSRWFRDVRCSQDQLPSLTFDRLKTFTCILLIPQNLTPTILPG